MIASQLEGREIVALLLAVAIASASPGVSFLAAADAAMAKIEASLPRTRAAELQRFMHRVMIDTPPEPVGAPPGPVVADLVDVFEAAFTANRHFLPRPHEIVMKPRPNAVSARSEPGV